MFKKIKMLINLAIKKTEKEIEVLDLMKQSQESQIKWTNYFIFKEKCINSNRKMYLIQKEVSTMEEALQDSYELKLTNQLLGIPKDKK